MPLLCLGLTANRTHIMQEVERNILPFHFRALPCNRPWPVRKKRSRQEHIAHAQRLSNGPQRINWVACIGNTHLATRELERLVRSLNESTTKYRFGAPKAPRKLQFKQAMIADDLLKLGTVCPEHRNTVKTVLDNYKIKHSL